MLAGVGRLMVVCVGGVGIAGLRWRFCDSNVRRRLIDKPIRQLTQSHLLNIVKKGRHKLLLEGILIIRREVLRYHVLRLAMVDG